MKNNLFKTALYGAVIASISLAGCSKNNDPNPDEPGGQEGTRWITLAAAQSSGTGGAPPTSANGNGGIFVYGITHEQAIDPTFELDIHTGANRGFQITSPRTSRIQASEDGTKLWDIQYLGDDAGVFSTYAVNGKNNYEIIGRQVNTQPILGNNPRWVKSTDEIGIAVNSDGETLTTEYTGTGLNATFVRNVRTVSIVSLDLKDPGMTNTRQVPVAFPDALAAQGYTLGRVDVPVLNKAQDKVYIGCNVSKIDPTKPTLNSNGQVVWTTTDPNREIGTATLVMDYPSFRNPEFIISEVAHVNNHGYRTKNQYVADDGHVYQAAASHGTGHQILRISSSTNKYDDSYEFNLNTALGINDAGIAVWKYIKDGIGVVLYRRGGSGAHLALIDLNAKTATPITTDVQQADEDLSTAIGQYQNITTVGDYVYAPISPSGKDGNLWVINWKTGEVTKGAKLKGYSFAHYIGSY